MTIELELCVVLFALTGFGNPVLKGLLSDPRVQVGLGEASQVTDVTVLWPGGLLERFGDFDAGREFILRKGSGASG